MRYRLRDKTTDKKSPCKNKGFLIFGGSGVSHIKNSNY
jgi:hypothetical protein